MWLKQFGAFEKVSGILLGTFSVMETRRCEPDIITLVKEYAGPQMPIAKTDEIGHGDDAKAIVIGREFLVELSLHERIFNICGRQGVIKF